MSLISLISGFHNNDPRTFIKTLVFFIGHPILGLFQKTRHLFPKNPKVVFIRPLIQKVYCQHQHLMAKISKEPVKCCPCNTKMYSRCGTLTVLIDAKTFKKYGHYTPPTAILRVLETMLYINTTSERCRFVIASKGLLPLEPKFQCIPNYINYAQESLER